MSDSSPQRRVYNADRKQALRHLDQAIAEGRLDIQDYEEFSGVIAYAEDMGELEDVVRRIQSLSTTGVPAPQTYSPAPAHIQPEEKTAWLANIERTGVWTVADGSKYTVNLGTLFLDMRQATSSAPVVRINVHVLLGSARIVVSPGVIVESEAELVMSDSPKINVDPPAPGAARIIVTGRIILGDLKVVSREAGQRLPLGFKNL
ncbi:DUF1707 domain-containing protein [Corynebacterium sp.]|uniref:DUF1707 SHOCT-like domain-containing protein n=1 Tax=Corynebacterium sp. TaxID=1720 RepID=UPI003736C3F9